MIFVCGPLKTYLMVVQNGLIQKLPHNLKNRGGGLMPLLDNLKKNKLFFVMDSCVDALFKKKMKKASISMPGCDH